MDNRIALATPHMSEEGFEQEYIKEAFDTLINRASQYANRNY